MSEREEKDSASTTTLGGPQFEVSHGLTPEALAFAADEFCLGYNTALADAALLIEQRAFTDPYPNSPSTSAVYWYGWSHAVLAAKQELEQAVLPERHPNPCDCDECYRRLARALGARQ